MNAENIQWLYYNHSKTLINLDILFYNYRVCQSHGHRGKIQK